MNKEIITVEDNPTKDKKQLVISIETPVVKIYQIEQVEEEIREINTAIESENRILSQYQNDLSEKQALLNKLNSALTVKPK